ncbi:MAG: peptidoglycan DL-endopeptidase CwlO [Actinomycetota bacterium]|nr:peptidoglycan DL-endopeptidase CwlO [Actinomycetota bacterium]
MSLSGRERTSRAMVLPLAVATLVAGLVVPLPASAAPKRPIEETRRQLEALHDQEEAATEKYNDLREDIASVKVRLTATQTKIGEQRKAVASARIALGKIASDTYKAGDLATLSLFLSDRPDEYVRANGVLMSLGDRKAQAMTDLLDRQQQLVASMTDVQEQQQRLEKSQRDLQATRIEVERRVSKTTEMLARLSGEEKARLGQLQIGQDRTSLEELGIKIPAGKRLTCDDVPVVAPNARVAKALKYACAQLGDPYLWGAEGPRNFDCSGLTLMAWKQAGVTLPRSSQQQARQGTKVKAENLQPGDLVFFHSGLTHVGIYIGKGLMLHAPRRGDVVKIVPMRYNSSFATAVRV